VSRGPLQEVLDAVDGGALTATELSRVTGLSTDLVRAALEQLQRMGRLAAEPVAMGCPPQGCGTCADAACSSGPVLVTLSRTH
jgi:hypothetical protein